MIVFVKPWQGYCGGERAGFNPALEQLLVRAGYAVGNVGDQVLPAEPAGRAAALAALANAGRPLPHLEVHMPPGPPVVPVSRMPGPARVPPPVGDPAAPTPEPEPAEKPGADDPQPPAPEGAEEEDGGDGPTPDEIVPAKSKRK